MYAKLSELRRLCSLLKRACHERISLHSGMNLLRFRSLHFFTTQTLPHQTRNISKMTRNISKMATLTLQSTVPLNTNHKLPQLGFGVWDSPSHLTTQSCLTALKTGYRHLDTAQVYGNETEVGEAMKQSGLPRGDIFVTTKVMSPEDDDAATYKKCLASVQKIAGDDGYVDLYLIHNVTCGAKGVKMLWQALEKLHKEGKAKSIGVSNTGIGIMEGMKSYAKVWPPAVDQLEVCFLFAIKMILSTDLSNSFTRGASNAKLLHGAKRMGLQSRHTVHLSGTKRQMIQT